jgi:hypothetical protein
MAMYNAPKDYAVTLVLASGEVVDTGIRKGEPIKDEFGKRALWRERAKHRREIAPAFEVWRLDSNVSGRNRVELPRWVIGVVQIVGDFRRPMPPKVIQTSSRNHANRQCRRRKWVVGVCGSGRRSWLSQRSCRHLATVGRAG